METIKDFVTIDHEIFGARPVLKGTDVPLESLFSHIERGISLDEFLNDYPTVNRLKAKKILEIAGVDEQRIKSLTRL